MKSLLSATPLEMGSNMNLTKKHLKQIETESVRQHLLSGKGLTTDDALNDLGIKDIYTPILRIRETIPVEETKVIRIHPSTGDRRELKYYFIDSLVIELYQTSGGRNTLKQQQQTSRISKARAKDNRLLKRMCEYCKHETMILKLHEIYGQQAANDD